eukprot:5417090-Alexandrium_andersonii.AAC.1
MSASLVGSEMCIRDSCHHRKEQRGEGAALSNAHLSHKGLHLSSANEPVSYTHLTLPTICSV